MDDDRLQRRVTFNDVALLYNQARPGYPAAVFDDIVRFSQLAPVASLLEIGCGTGQATVPLAERGYRIDTLELGTRLAGIARDNLAPFPAVRVIVADFETWSPDASPYDLIFSASAFHWIAPHLQYTKTASLLRPEGTLALIWNKHVQTAQSEPFLTAVQKVYHHFVPELAAAHPSIPHPDNVPTPVRNEIEASDHYTDVTVSTYAWQQEYTATAYTALLNTYSDNRLLNVAIRRRLFQDIEHLIDDAFGGAVVKEYLTILYQARRIHGSSQVAVRSD
jgi:trans-aconitate methyltransferase